MAGRTPTAFSLHHLFKTEEVFSSRSIAGLFARFGMVRIVKLHDMETALVHIEVDIAQVFYRVSGETAGNFRVDFIEMLFFLPFSETFSGRGMRIVSSFRLEPLWLSHACVWTVVINCLPAAGNITVEKGNTNPILSGHHNA